MRTRMLAPVTIGLTGAVLACAAVAPAHAGIVAEPIIVQAHSEFSLTPIGTYETGEFDKAAAEIVAYFAAEQRLLVVNALDAVVEVLDVSDPTTPAKLFDLQTTGIIAEDESMIPADAVANSVAIRADGLGAVAVENDPKTDDGWVVFFDAAGNGSALGAVRVSAQPDMLTFTPDGSRVVVAGEGEPAEDYSVDPEGTVVLIDVPASLALPAQGDVTTLDFHEFEAPSDGGTKPLPAGVRIYGGREDAGTGTPDYPVSENLEPEYVAVSSDSSTAWVTLQEANGLAIVDLTAPEITEVVDLGTIDRSAVALDASDRDHPSLNEDPAINITTWDYLRSFYQPDAIAAFEADGATFLATANEGDSRDWAGYSEETRVKNLEDDGLGPVCDEVDAAIGEDWQLGRLNVTVANGFDETTNCYSTLYAFGGRSFSIWDASGALVWDSGSDFEQITADALPEWFNSDHAEVDFDGRSDNKGPEPEAITVAEIEGRLYAFIALERLSGVMVYDVTSPEAPSFVYYINNRDFTADAETDLAAAGDLGPEGLAFISAQASPTGEPMLAVASEVSGTTTLYTITAPVSPDETLPDTGTDSIWLAAAAASGLLAGGLLLALRRRARA